MLLIACGFHGLSADELSGAWSLYPASENGGIAHDVEWVAAEVAEGGGYWLASAEGISLVYEGRYLLREGRLVRVAGGPALYSGIAWKADGDGWIFDGDPGNKALRAYDGVRLRRRVVSSAPGYDELGRSRLYVAALDGRAEDIEALLAGGESVDVRNSNPLCRTALFAAIDAGHTKVVAQLLKHGATVNQRDTNGVTPLMAAGHSSGPYRALVRILLDAGADPQLQDKKSRTAAERLKQAAALNFELILLEELAKRTSARVEVETQSRS